MNLTLVTALALLTLGGAILFFAFVVALGVLMRESALGRMSG